MAKFCLKKDLKKLGNDIDDLIMLEDSARGTLCAIHKTIHSTDNFPCSKHKMLKLCPVPKLSISPCTRVSVRSRRKSQSNSPCYDRPKMYRTQSANNSNRRCCTVPHLYCQMEKNNTHSIPEYQNTKYVNIEKTNSCPEKVCCHNSASNKTCTITSRSSVHIDRFAQNLINTDEVVNELKGEIAKVKHQLQHLSQQRLEGYGKSKIPCLVKGPPSTPEDREESEMSKVKSENKRLRREIEAKKKLLEKSRNDINKAKDILADYEKKVSLLHVQALKSAKAMKVSKEKFCNCIKEKDEKIKSLKESNQTLEKLVKENATFLSEKEVESQVLNENISSLKKVYEETSEKCATLATTNQNFLESIDSLRNQLMNSAAEVSAHKETILTLENKLGELNCICKRVVSKTRKQKENYLSTIKNSEEDKAKLTQQISELSTKLLETEQQKGLIDELQCKCMEFQQRIQEYEAFSEKCKILEEECKNEHEKLIASQADFQKEKEEMEKLIDELTTVVKQNKITLLQMTEINRQQQSVINSQSMALLTKEEQLKLVENESEEFKKKTEYLEQEVEQLKKTLSEPCSKEACLCISKELAKIKNALNVEKDTHLLKEKIIEDQSQTILTLQSQVKEKMSELNKAQSDTKYLEEEIGRINEKLIKKHQELDAEIDEKENLVEKLRMLECQKNQLSEEIGDFENMLYRYKDVCGDNEKQQTILKDLQEQITEQKRQWDTEKESIAKGKQKAVCAAKFATQKLLDTVENFQRQVDAQKKVQILLTRMLHEKDEQLRIVQSKISNINTITKDIAVKDEPEISMKELFFRKTLENVIPSDQNTTTSMYSSCSSCCKKPDYILKQPKYSNIVETADQTVQQPKYSKIVETANQTVQQHCSAPCSKVHNFLKVLSNSMDQIKEESNRD